MSRLLRSNLTVAAGTTLSRLTGLLRVVALTYVLGQTALTDAYSLANETPNIVYELLLGGVLSATFVPLFSTFDEDDDERVDQRRAHGVGGADDRAHAHRRGRRPADLPGLLARRRRRRRSGAVPLRRHHAGPDLPGPDPLLRTRRSGQRVPEQPAPILRRGVEPDPAQRDHHRHAVVAAERRLGRLGARRRALRRPAEVHARPRRHVRHRLDGRSCSSRR